VVITTVGCVVRARWTCCTVAIDSMNIVLVWHALHGGRCAVPCVFCYVSVWWHSHLFVLCTVASAWRRLISHVRRYTSKTAQHHSFAIVILEHQAKYLTLVDYCDFHSTRLASYS